MFKAELHVHSSHSDGRDGVRKILERAVELGLNVISITDHDTINGSLEAEEIVEEENLPIKVIPGFESSTAEGHLLVYGVRKDFEAGLEFREAVELVRKLGGVCFVAHPFQVERKGVWRISSIELADGVEAFNSKFVIGIFNYLSLKLAKKLKKPVIAGSDAHSVEAIGYGLTLVEKATADSLTSGKTKIAGKRMPLRVWIRDAISKI